MSRVRRIGLVMQGGAGWMGGMEYVRNLVQALAVVRAESSSGPEVHLFAGGTLPDGVRKSLEQNIVLHERLLQGRDALGARLRYLLRRRLLRQPNARMSDWLRAADIDFLYPLTYDNLHNIGVSLPIGNAFGKTHWAGWVPDFQHRHMPELFSPVEREKRDTGIAALASEAKTLVFSSESAAADFRSFYPHSAARVEVLRFHTHPSPKWYDGDPENVQRHFHLPDAFFLVSNQFWQHKNHVVVWKALKILQQRGLHPAVVCTGYPGDFRNKDYFNGLLRSIHELGVASQVHILGLIEREEQIQLMRRSIAVIQPSLFEGWSTVVEDARALGKRVVASDIAVHREQDPPGGLLFDKSSPEKLADAVGEMLRQGSPGPDPAKEAAARATAEQALLRYGRRFLEIVEAGSR